MTNEQWVLPDRLAQLLQAELNRADAKTVQRYGQWLRRTADNIGSAIQYYGAAHIRSVSTEIVPANPWIDALCDVVARNRQRQFVINHAEKEEIANLIEQLRGVMSWGGYKLTVGAVPCVIYHDRVTYSVPDNRRSMYFAKFPPQSVLTFDRIAPEPIARIEYEVMRFGFTLHEETVGEFIMPPFLYRVIDSMIEYVEAGKAQRVVR